MDQNSVLVENIASKPVDGTHGKPVELSTKNDHRGILTPEVSNLITSVNELAIQNFEFLKVARETGHNLGFYQIRSRKMCLLTKFFRNNI